MTRAILVPLFMVCTACTQTVYVPVERTQTITKIERDTIIDIRLEKEVVIVHTRDTIAHAETQYAEADATYDGSAGQLALSLRNKNIKIPIETKYIEVVRVDSLPYPVEVIKTKEVRVVPWYDKVIRYAALAVIILSALGFNIRKLFN